MSQQFHEQSALNLIGKQCHASFVGRHAFPFVCISVLAYEAYQRTILLQFYPNPDPLSLYGLLYILTGVGMRKERGSGGNSLS